MSSSRIVTDSEVIQEGTSLFIERTNEVVWITDIHDEYVKVETLSNSGNLPKEQLVQRIHDADIVVESQPVH